LAELPSKIVIYDKLIIDLSKIAVIMSTVRSDLTNSRKGNYSFANHNEDHTFTNVSLPRKKRPTDPSPSKPHKHTRETR
jgi:hypothetical protein